MQGRVAQDSSRVAIVNLKVDRSTSMTAALNAIVGERMSCSLTKLD